MKVNIRLKELRNEKGYTQKELAKMLNVSTSTISKFENNKLKYNLILLVNASILFDVSTDYIMGLSNKRERKIKPDY